MAQVTITVDADTIGFIESGFAFTMWNGRESVRERRQVAYDDWRKALANAQKENE